MRRTNKISAPLVAPLRKSTAVVSRRAFPAWIDSEQGTTFNASQVAPRVRDGLVLRLVSQKKSTRGKPSTDAHGGR